ncbi:hypothetical protein [Helicobacter himalayensis]|nr:hypothetical protein [Helicobacter himalayensis]
MPEESLKDSKRDISHFSNVQYDKRGYFGFVDISATPQYDKKKGGGYTSI